MLASSLSASRAVAPRASRAFRDARSSARRTARRARAPARVAAKLEDTPKFVRDSRDDAKAAQPPDAGRTAADVEAFIADLSGDAKGDSPVTQTLNKEFGLSDGATPFVRVRDGRGSLTKVTLTHPSGSYVDVYLKGGNVASWVLASGGEVLYVPDDASFKKHAPTDGGNPVCFPQFGAGGERPGSVGAAKMPEDGFANRMEWRIGETGTYASSDGTSCPFVTLELTDDDSSRAAFNHNFKLTQEISLEHNALKVKMTCANTGSTAFEYAIGRKAHIAVSDVREGDVYYVGFEDCVVLDNCLHPTKPRVRFTKDLDAMSERCFKLDGPTDRVYLATEDLATGVEVGTGCTVFAQNLSGERGCVDRAVFNPWEASPKTYRWYAGLGIGNFGKLRVAEPDTKSSTEIQYKVVDSTPSIGIREDFELFEKVNARNMFARPKIDLSNAELPDDMQ